MKGKTNSRGLKTWALSGAVGLALGLGMTACSRDYVVGYVYATTAKSAAGIISAYSIDYQSGLLTQLADSPIPSGGSNPVTLVASPNGRYLYVLNHDTSSVVEFAIGTDGKIYPENTYDVVQGNGVTGTFPTAAAIDPSGSYIYITFTYQNGFTTLRPGPGGLAAFPIKSDGSLGTALTNTTIGTTAANPLPYIPLGNNPVAVTIPATGGFVYVIDQEGPPGKLLSFAENTSTGALTVLGTATGISVGSTPSAITEGPGGRFLYITDSAANQLYTFAVAGGVPGATPVFTYATGLGPDAVTVDPRGAFVYVANFGASTVGTYTINSTTGALTSAGASQAVGTGPTCVTIDPAIGLYLYTSNTINNTISAEQLNPKTGTLVEVQGTPFTSQPLPTCAVAVANGAHTSQIVQ